MSTWKVSSLGEIVDRSGGLIQTGPFGSQLHSSDYTDDPGGVPLVMPKDMIEGRVDYISMARVSPEKAKEMHRHVCRPGDVLLSRRGDIGRCVLISEADAGILCGTGSLRVAVQGTELDPGFLFHYLSTTAGRAELEGRAVGATMPNINASIVRSVAVPVPPLSTQRKIAAILDVLIENNNRRIKILEEMAHRIYREWFVTFRFPGHQDAPLTEWESRRLPAHWAARRFGDVLELVYGKSLRADVRRDGPVAVFGSGGMIGTHDEALDAGPGLIVGRKGNVGALYWSDGPFFAIDTTYWVRSQLPLSYCYYALSEMTFLDSHAAVPGLSREQAYGMSILVPDPETLHAFDALVMDFFRLRQRLRNANETLRSTRDLLLPRLVSGAIDVEHSKILVDGAAA